MKLVNKIDVGDFHAKMYQTTIGGNISYIYKIFYKVGKKNFCIDRCYVYLFDKQECYNKMKESLDVALGMRENLLNMKGC